ncbi:galactose-1-epimerase [Mesorhizobium sp. M2A.F.Ca.ET.037.01.1.1]|uniref:aldose epimerase family protein n=1 Tax=unclassified Mesorhizobium TaxID=325217 RepID=UPI000F753519|nr:MULTISPECIES: aldose epimerase family protein [unclassified Mesorhizobium]RVC63872.1 galactose-1-epimerase [Mesorhizobium sp. M00.F.Ca.ET.038.03.1.1]RVC67540.1 galactose-1-epimerase [Mesorhizobium sp. M2A.F.Ca.ET.046.02.1.1]AZO37836.1 galactose mutarotase [Mesorhizobium sp. M2A.F.Ca.ET.046.03.2.1]RUX19730.1 galactose-1-epimerase [Mesorhizobium sp. M2A.F.Ca.ET.037.01.1.1]RWA93887.1 MAG: galactose-1-epimerase [Mesorhizobium sp.]
MAMKDGEVFGTTQAGEAVRRFTIRGGGLTANIIGLGAIVQDLRLNGHDAPLVLGYDRFEPYETDRAFFGAVVGRFANRIGGGRFTIAGQRYQTEQNFLGKHTLHGGSEGFFHRPWTVSLHGRDFVTLTLHDPDGAMGFPGALDVTCTYRLKIPGTLSMELTATCEQPTLCNLAQHSYFNLDDGGVGDILDHRLMLNASAYTPVDDEMIPTGVVKPVDGTPFDFRQARALRMEMEGEQLQYDLNYCLASSRGPLHQAAWVQGANSGVEMEVWTTEPGLQLYSGQFVAPASPGLDGRHYKAFSGLCLEAQTWPDAPNRPYFPQATLWPGQIYHQVTEYRFRLP